MASGSITSWKIDRETVGRVADFFEGWGTPKSLQMVTAAMKLKDTPWKESYDQSRQHIKKQRHYFANNGPSIQGYGFSSGPVLHIRWPKSGVSASASVLQMNIQD